MNKLLAVQEPPGGRHDNDDVDFTQIQIVPTQDVC
jgi:hypothetical protein